MGLGLSAGDVRLSITLVDSITSEGPGAGASTTCPGRPGSRAWLESLRFSFEFSQQSWFNECSTKRADQVL